MLLKFEVGLFLDCGVHPYKHLWIFQKRLAARIWDFLTFKIYYLGPLAQNFRSLSLFLRKLEPFCRYWLEKFCLVAKIQHFLPYLKTQVKSSFGLDNFINITWSIYYISTKNGVYTGIRWPLNSFLKNYTKNHQKSRNFNIFSWHQQFSGV